MCIKDSDAQQICANSWKILDIDTCTHFENEARSINNSNESYISNARVRKARLDKTIQEIRKMVLLKLVFYYNSMMI